MHTTPKLNLIIPMAGEGKRFKAAGYKEFKPFIEINGKPMIQYVTDNFPHWVRKYVITSINLLSPSQSDFLKNELGCDIIHIPPHAEGPAFTIMAAASQLPLDEAFFISYCDISWLWDFDAVSTKLDADGIIFTHSGFHPHLINNSYSAFCLPSRKDQILLERIKEKESFTREWMDEPLSVGAFYVKDGHAMIRSIERLIEKDMRVSGEFFPSLLFNGIVDSGKRVLLDPVKFFIHWGVPEQLEDFNRWRDIWVSETAHEPVKGKTYPKNIVCMAGEGVRMKGVSDVPKALAPVCGKPLYEFVAAHFPSSSVTVIANEDLAETLRQGQYADDCLILERQTKSQFETLRLAAETLTETGDYFLTSCDAFGVFDYSAFRSFVNKNRPDAVIFTFQPSLVQQKLAGQHTHVSSEGDFITAVHVKTRSCDADSGFAGFFWIRDGSIFKHMNRMEGAVDQEMIVDHVFQFFVQNGIKVMKYDLDHYVHLGTPEEYLEYRFWMEKDDLFKTD